MLRVISGTAKGHKLKTIKGNTTRPTSDRVKESLFNIIAGYIPGAEVLDLFGGTGNLGIEALSRGAGFAVIADKSAQCTATIRENLEHTKLLEKSLIVTGDAQSVLNKMALEHRKFDVIFLDPPYSSGLLVESLNSIVKKELLKADSIVVGERDAADVLPEEVGNLKLIRNQKYGDTVLSFYRLPEDLKGQE